MAWKEYAKVLEDQVAMYEEAFALRDFPQSFLAKRDRLHAEAEKAREAVGKKIDAHKEANPGQAKHGELA